ncbi:DNA cytosine methyltransferase [Paenibacillus sp. P2(2022)]|uniref:DNA cytosine methyltransferase n=1 Tax=Paenibacillus sp. P2(2022) TaxID=2917813 RepID=UPI0024071C9C|nr:DNA cytosine methyltransferase [Paenibacillus sp. P2(2022)]MDG0053044.1 DNA cytosine methyltransferase [Paenibacillus sp. P2(2022)]
MRKLSLFSGIGGIDLAAHWAGMETVAFCEREPFPQAVLRKHWPDVPIYDDVCTLTADRLKEDGVIGPGRAIDLVSAGYPCQPESLAGKRRGTEDDRWLWPEVARVLQEVRPRWFLGENVAGHISMGLDTVLSDLERFGYTTQTFVIPACAVGAPHRRDRVFIASCTDDVGDTERSGCSGQPRGRSKQVATNGYIQLEERALAYTKGESSRRLSIGAAAENTRFARRSENVAYPSSIGQSGSREFIEPSNQTESGAGKTSEPVHDRIGAEWAAQSGLGGMLNGLSRKLDEHRWPAALGQEQYNWEPPRVATGIKDRVGRLKALGNAVNPHQVYPVLAAIKAINDSL